MTQSKSDDRRRSAMDKESSTKDVISSKYGKNAINQQNPVTSWQITPPGYLGFDTEPAGLNLPS